MVAFTFWKEPVCFQMSVKILVSLFTLYYALRPLYLVLRDLTFAVPWGVRSCDFHYLLFHQLGAAVTHSQLFLGVLIFPHISLLQLFVIDPAVSRSFHLPQSPLCQKLLLIVPGKPCPQLLFFFFFFLPEHLCLDDSKFLWPSFDSHVLTKSYLQEPAESKSQHAFLRLLRELLPPHLQSIRDLCILCFWCSWIH